MDKCLNPGQCYLQVVDLSIILRGCEIVSTEGVQQQRDEKVAHLREGEEGEALSMLTAQEVTKPSSVPSTVDF